YLGAFSLLLALFGLLLSERRWMTRTLALVAVVALLLASGKYGPVYGKLFEVCPLFRYGRYPVKYLLTFNFSLALLAGYGVHRILALREAGRWSLCLKRPWVVACLIFLVLSFGASLVAERQIGERNNDPEAVLPVSHQGKTLEVPRLTIVSALQSLQLQLGALAVFLALSWIGAVRPSIVKASAVVLLLFDFGIHDYWINPLIHSELYEAAPAAKYIQERDRTSGPFRIHRLEAERLQEDASTMGKTNSIVWNYFYRRLTLAQFLSAKDHVSYAVFQPVDRLETLPSQRIHAELMATQATEEKLQFLAGLNVEYVLAVHDIDSPRVVLDSTFPVNSPQPLRLYRLLNPLPRVFLSESKGPADGEESFREQLSVRGESGASSATGSETPRILNYRPNQIEIETKTSQNCLLVLLDSYYPGWSAFVDAVPTPVIAANFVYRAINLPQGRHRVTFRYEPKSFVYGAAISGCTALIWGVVWVASLFRRSAVASSSHAHV
ncbi:MAG: YfhO family protein, partial [Terriglobia bacterium]